MWLIGCHFKLEKSDKKTKYFEIIEKNVETDVVRKPILFPMCEVVNECEICQLGLSVVYLTRLLFHALLLKKLKLLFETMIFTSYNNFNAYQKILNQACEKGNYQE